MWLPVPVDLKSLSFDRTYELLAPLLPGGFLAFGFVLGHPDVMVRTASVLELGPYSRWVFLIVSAYASGFLFYYISVWPSILLGGVVSRIVRRERSLRPETDKRGNLTSSKRQSWRKVAIKLFGADLFPASETSEEWYDWYNALQDYITGGERSIPSQIRITVNSLSATGWSIVIVRMSTPVFHHWFFWVPAILAILLETVVLSASEIMYWSTDRMTYWSFTARLLRELRKKEKRDLPK